MMKVNLNFFENLELKVKNVDWTKMIQITDKELNNYSNASFQYMISVYDF